MKFIIANDIKSAGRYKSDGISLFEADSHLICKAQSVVCLGKILLLISGLLLFVIGAWGQRVNKITTNEGLSQGFVIGIEQGRNGFIWATSLNGLNRFDGENFKIYKHHPSDSLSLASDIVSRLLKDIEGHIWVLNNKSFQVYDEIRDGFVTPAYFKKQPLTTNGSIIFDELNRLWVFEGDTIFGYSVSVVEDKKGYKPVVSEIPPYILPSKYGKIVTLFATKDKMYVGTEQGRVYELVLETGAINTLALPLTSKVTRVWIDPQFGGLWVQSPDKSLYYDEGRVQVFEDVKSTNSVQAVSGKANNGATYLFSNTNIWVWDNVKLRKLPIEIPEFILSACLDHQGNIWVGTNAQGIRHIELKHYNFPIIQPGICSMHPVRVAPDGSIWVYVPSRNNINLGHYQRLLPDGQLGEAVSPLLCYDMAIDTRNRFWMAQDNRIALINAPGTVPLYMDLPPLSGYPKQIYCGRDGQVWVTTTSWELIRYDTETEGLEVIQIGSLSAFSAKSFINKLYYSNFFEDETGRIWLGLSAGMIGLKLDETGKVGEKVVWNGEVNGISVLKEHGVLSIAAQEGNPDMLWIGTPSGLVRWHSKTKTTELFSIKDGLPDDYVYSVIDGGMGELWLGTNKGLVGFRPDTRFSRLLTESDGLPAAEFNTACAVKSVSDSRLYFNTVSGIISFRPTDLTSSGQRSRMVLTGMSVNGKALSVTSVSPDVFQFSHLENSITIDYALLSFSNATVNRYEYKINTENGPWIHVGTKNTLTFPLLPPGRYSIWVKGINSEGQESEPLKIAFIIRWPWWKTWWAYGGLALIGLLLVWIGVRIRIRFQQMRFEYALNAQKIADKEASERQRMRLLENVTHEIKTPLTVILGQVHQMKAGWPENTPADWNLLERGVNDLNDLSNQVLQLSKSQGVIRPPKLKSGNLILLVQQIADYYQYLANLKSVDFQIDTDLDLIWVKFDEIAIKGIVSNLLSNAIKFTGEKGSVHLGLHREQDKITIIVSDTGIGMKQEVKSRVFERFYQSEEAQKYTGTGIGLSYVHELVKGLDGHIRVESEEGNGSVFTVELPFLAAEDAALQQDVITETQTDSGALLHKPETPMTTGRALILVVEDNPAVAAYIVKCLEAEHQVICASDGIAGQKMAVERMPDLIITDLMMPGLNGWEFCAQIKNDILTNHIPVVMVTALAEASDRLKGLGAGADAYIAKPFLQEELVLVINNLLLLRQRSATQNTVPDREQSEPLFITRSILREVEAHNVAFVQKVMAVIEGNFSAREFTLAELEKAVRLSRTQLYRKMVAVTGKPAGFFLRRRRLEEGMYLLQNRSDMNITEISYACGFNDPNYFSTAFSAEFGHPPSYFQV